MSHVIPGDLPAVWRKRAEYLREFGDPNSARLWELGAIELERAMQVFSEETLSLTEAARESGYTADHLGALVKRGKIPNAGRTNAPRIRRHDLPNKGPNGPGRPTRRRSVPSSDDIRRIAQSHHLKETR
ncbi:MAG: hypothetical protein M3O61_16645 [Gemmatimonadota bacterium]|nr:hypothetical protein [Gemmatimonadota bacterium]